MADFVDDGFSTDESRGKSKSPSGGLLSDSHTDRVVTARGTEDGLVLRIDGKSDWSSILSDIESFLGGRKRFFQGGQISIEWLERLPTKEQSHELEQLLRDEYGIAIATRKRRPNRRLSPDASDVSDDASANASGGNPSAGEEVSSGAAEETTGSSSSSGVTIPLFNEISEDSEPFGGAVGSLEEQVEKFTAETLGEYYTPEGVPLAMKSRDSAEQLRRKYINRVARLLGDEIYYDDEANAKIVYGTLRSGQRVETPFSLIVIGDVNPGADLTAGGDIIVMGSLRGTAHASAYDDDSFDRVIVALHMQPMQLRIGSVISRGSEEVVEGAEIARIDNRRIIVEPYSPRKLFSKKLR